MLVPGANSGGRAVQQDQTRQGQTGGLSVSGGRTNNTAFMLDGAVNIDPDYNALNYSPSIDAIAEFQVQTAMYPAEFGRASGGQVNVVTKSGGNAFHGSAFEFLRNNALDARPFNLPTPTLPEYRRNQFGATLGGPAMKSKLFWFFAYEGLRLRQAGAGLTTVTVPTALQRSGDFSATKGGIFDPDTLQNGLSEQQNSPAANQSAGTGGGECAAAAECRLFAVRQLQWTADSGQQQLFRARGLHVRVALHAVRKVLGGG